MSTTGKFTEREMPNYRGRDWTERGFTVGIGGSVRLVLCSHAAAADSERVIGTSQSCGIR